MLLVSIVCFSSFRTLEMNPLQLQTVVLKLLKSRFSLTDPDFTKKLF
ncbi:hypothetical protein IIM_01444 [Bacillus cereus VD107]|nr:hypothetical protein IIM_01444 [Bacillus cereus VD107]